MGLMDYRKEKNKDDIFIYSRRKKSKKKIKFINKNNNPFKKLMSLNLKWLLNYLKKQKKIKKLLIVIALQKLPPY